LKLAYQPYHTTNKETHRNSQKLTETHRKLRKTKTVTTLSQTTTQTTRGWLP